MIFSWKLSKIKKKKRYILDLSGLKNSLLHEDLVFIIQR